MVEQQQGHKLSLTIPTAHVEGEFDLTRPSRVETTTTTAIAQDQSAYSCMPATDVVGPTLSILAPP